MSCVTVTHTTRTYPRLPYEQIKDTILGSNYELSLVFVGETRARQLNQAYRNKDYTPDVLSFPLDDTHGEMFLCLQKIYRIAPRYGRSKVGQVGFLFIHGLLHLKGYSHGATMEEAEKKYCTKFKIK